MRFNKYQSDELAYSGVIDNLLMEGEQVIWRGKPKKNAYIINRSLTMLPIALVWLLIDMTIIVAFLKDDQSRLAWLIVIPFFAVHLAPVWLWLGNMLTANRRWKNAEYVVTDKRIILKNGFIGYEYQSINYIDIDSVNLRAGFIDRLLKVGDIHIQVNGMQGNKNKTSTSILDIENAVEVYKMLHKTVLDIQTDIHYPNKLRPAENDGYQTRYNIEKM